jgi:hypothetical protein
MMPTPYRMDRGEAGYWAIRSGASKFLIAEGSGYSYQIGKHLLAQLNESWNHRRGKPGYIGVPVPKRRKHE